MRAATLALLGLTILASPVLAQGNLLEQGKRMMQGGSGGGSSSGSSLSQGQIGDGLREALRVGAERTVGKVSKPGGFLNDSAIRIKPPGMVEKAEPLLKMAGYGNVVDDLEHKMNAAAEATAPKAQAIFVDAISKMTIDDARQILSGPQDAATQYLKKTSSDGLMAAMKPVVERSVADVGALRSYESLLGSAKSIPGASGLNFDLAGYVTQKAMDGLFHYIGVEEAAIRSNPAARTTDLLKTVFK